MDKFNPFIDFKLHEPVDNKIIEKYSSILPPEMIDFWKQYGFGTFAKGFLKSINPEEYQELLDEAYISKSKFIPVFATALGDILVVKEFFYSDGERYLDIYIIHYRYGIDSIVRGVENFFSDVIFDLDSYMFSFYWDSYIEAVKEYGIIPQYNQCYGYVPLLGLGGNENVGNMQIVKTKEHIMLITEMLGAIQSRS